MKGISVLLQRTVNIKVDNNYTDLSMLLNIDPVIVKIKIKVEKQLLPPLSNDNLKWRMQSSN